MMPIALKVAVYKTAAIGHVLMYESANKALLEAEQKKKKYPNVDMDYGNKKDGEY